MNNYIEYNDKVAFHPGYYLKEIVDESGLTQEDFAKRLGTTPKNLSVLIRGDQSLSIDIAIKLSRMLGTSVIYWLNLQQAYDEKLAEIQSDEEDRAEKDSTRMVSTVLIDKDAAIAAIKKLEIDGPQMIWSSDAIDAVKGVEEDVPRVPDVKRVIDNLRIIRTWASCGAITRGDCPSITKILDNALALIEAQHKTLDEIDKYVRELDKAVNGNGKSTDRPT